MKDPNKLLSTHILDHHGKIGPFFFKEFIFVFLGCTTLFFLVLLLSLFIHIKGILLLLIPSTFLILIGVIRLTLAKRVASPWYMHKWVSQRILRPKHILANTLPGSKNPSKEKRMEAS
jgi:hypothetical protein